MKKEDTLASEKEYRTILRKLEESYTEYQDYRNSMNDEINALSYDIEDILKNKKTLEKEDIMNVRKILKKIQYICYIS